MSFLLSGLRMILLTGILLILYSCVEIFQPDVAADESKVLVVEGNITDETGPFRVKLTSSFKVNNLQLYGEPVAGASVRIADSDGSLFQLDETAGGWYETADKQLKGKVGNTYMLEITTTDGRMYESTPVLMQAAPNIDSIYFEEGQVSYISDQTTVTENELNILVDATDTTGEISYWKWDFTETWEVILPVDNALVYHGSVEQSQVPKSHEKVEIGPVQEDTCWRTVPSTRILIASTSETTGHAIQKFGLQSIPPYNDRLHVRYSILVKQYALSKEMYGYWKDLKQANEDPGSIYERNPSQIFGNIQCCDGTVHALGYFYASAVSSKRIFISPGDYNLDTKSYYSGCTYVTNPNPRSIFYYFGKIISSGQPVYTFVKECADCQFYGSDKKPDYW